MTVASASTSSDIALTDEIRQCKSALLYADNVKLVSPRAALIGSVAAVRTMSDLDRLRLIVEVAPIYAPDQAHILHEILVQIESLPPGNQLTSPQRRARREAISNFFEQFRPVIDLILAKAHESVEQSKFSELDTAIDAGLLTIDPLAGMDVGHTDRPERESPDIALEYIERVGQILTDDDTYPLFDNLTSDIVRFGVDGGIFVPVSSSRTRGRDASMADGLFDRLPNFEHATISEILDIRTELRSPLLRFRQGVRDISKDIETAPENTDFVHYIEDAWTHKVAPALDEIEEVIQQNTGLRSLMRKAIQDAAGAAGVLGTGSIVVAAGPAAGTAAAATLLLGGAGATLGGFTLAGIRAFLQEQEAIRSATGTQFYFLYGTNSRLAPR
ncbi:hypothetical protein ACLMAL_26230 [Nocardia sp. CWNU-33]|uniref:hypothetical protein n=1 Tax=Nocardia sp. CWNU-33 TaxID=3392117 RepID=UPI00398F568E